MEEARRQEDLRCAEQRAIEEHRLEELQCAVRPEALRDSSRKTDIEDKVTNFLRCCLRLLNDPDVARKLT